MRLDLPAAPRFLSAARVVATSLGADAGLSVDDLDDLRLGVNELVTALVDGAEPGARLCLDFLPGPGSISVFGEIEGGRGISTSDDLTTRILSAVVDHFELGSTSFVLTKASSLREYD